MADTFQLTDGTTTVDLIYNASTNPNYKLRSEGARLGSMEPRTIWHRPGDHAAELIETIDDVQQISLTITVHKASGVDDALNAIVKARRLLRQAERYNSTGDVARVTLKIQRDGATNATLWPVLYGWVDDGEANYRDVAGRHGIIYDANMTLFLAPYGEAENSITLRNYLPSSPHMLHDSNSDGLADNLTAIGSPTFSMSATHALIGHRSQQVVTDASNSQGIKTVTIAVGSGVLVNAKVYLAVATSSEDNISMDIVNNAESAAIQTKTHITGGATQETRRFVARTGGLTWYEYTLGGTTADSTGVKLRVQRRSTSATKATTFFVDGMYINVQGLTSTPPIPYVSARSIDNRFDPVTGSEAFINYVDVWGVPGDAPALVDIELDWTVITGSKALAYGGRFSDGILLASQITGWRDSSVFSTGTAVNSAWSTGTGTSNNHYHRLTQDGSGSAGSGSIFNILTGENGRRLVNRTCRVFGICRSSNINTRFRISVTPVGGVFFSSEEVGITTTGQWELVDFGLLNTRGRSPYDPPDTSALSVNVSCFVTDIPASSSATADIDALLFMPTDEFIVVDTEATFTNATELHIRGHNRDAIHSGLGITASMMGTLWTLDPGEKTNRYRFAICHRTTNLYTLSDAADVTLTVTPRTRHLLGTL